MSAVIVQPTLGIIIPTQSVVIFVTTTSLNKVPLSEWCPAHHLTLNSLPLVLPLTVLSVVFRRLSMTDASNRETAFFPLVARSVRLLSRP